LVQFLAILWATALAWSLVTGTARSIGGIVTRREQPLQYWISVAIYAAFTALFATLGPVR